MGHIGGWIGPMMPYKVSTVRKFTLHKPGVYVLWVKREDGNAEMFYVGITTDLRQRLLEHLDEHETNECIRKHVSKWDCAFSYAFVEDSGDRLGIGQYIYNHYKPSCSIVAPEGNPIPILLPKPPEW